MATKNKKNTNSKIKAFPKKSTAWLRNTSWKKRAAVIIFIIAITAFVFLKIRSKGENGYVFETVGKHNITEVVSESGNVTTAGKTNIYSPTNGIIEAVYVKNDDIVGIDQELFKVVSTATEDDKVTAYANLASAQSTLKTAEHTKMTLQSTLEVARKAILDGQQAVDNMVAVRSESKDNPATGDSYTRNEIDSIESTLTSSRWTFSTAEKKYVEADVTIESARAALAKANLAYESTKDRIIKSSTIGTVSNVSVSVGGAISASTGTSSLAALGLAETAVPALTIANFSSNEIILALNESDISKIQIGQISIIDPDAINNLTYSGAVKRVDSISHDDGGVVAYKVYVDILDADMRLRSGMTVDVDITTNEMENVLAVKNSSIKPYQGGRAVRVLNTSTGELDYLPVVIGVRGDEYTQILEGVAEGQEIVASLTNEKIERGGLLGF